MQEALSTAAELGLRLVTGVEITAVDVDQQDLHILGYLIDDRDPDLLGRLASYRAYREQRADAMIAALEELGFDVDVRALRARTDTGRSVGRPHLAAAVVSQAANRERLEREHRLDPSAFLEAYLIEGRPAFRPRRGPSVAQAIATIHEAGGVAVWAHPFWDVAQPAKVLAMIDRFRGDGIDGVECFYATYNREQTELLADRCAELGLLSTGSSDFHGPEHRVFSRFRAFNTYGHEPVLGPIAA